MCKTSLTQLFSDNSKSRFKMPKFKPRKVSTPGYAILKPIPGPKIKKRGRPKKKVKDSNVRKKYKLNYSERIILMGTWGFPLSGTRKAIFKQGIKYAEYVRDHNVKSCISLMICGSATGNCCHCM